MIRFTVAFSGTGNRVMYSRWYKLDTTTVSTDINNMGWLGQ